MESILAYNLRTRFFPNMQFSQNYIANYGASFKVEKGMLPSLKCQIFRFWSKFVWFTKLSRQQIQFSKIQLCHFLVYTPKYPMQKIKKTHWVDPDKNASQTDRYTDKHDWFYRTPSAKTEVFDHVFRKLENNISLNNLAWLWAVWKESMQEKGIQSP